MSWCKMPVVSIHPVSSYRRLKGILCYFWAIFDPPYLGAHCLAPVSAPFVKVTKVPFLGSSIHRLSLW